MAVKSPLSNERRRIIEVNGWLPCLITSRFTDVPSVNSIMENHNFQRWGSYHWTKLMASSSQLVTVFQGNFRNSTTAGINSCRPFFSYTPAPKTSHTRPFLGCSYCTAEDSPWCGRYSVPQPLPLKFPEPRYPKPRLCRAKLGNQVDDQVEINRC